MIVIVEGIDRVGKTTLCEKLKEKGFVILKDEIDILKGRKNVSIKSFAIGSAAKVDSTFIFAKQLSDQGVNVVLDRCHLTEIVYGYLGRGACEINMVKDAELKFVDQTVNDSLLVLVEPTDVKEACERAGEDLSAHVKLFERVFSTSPMSKLKTNFNELDDAVRYIMKYKKEAVHDS